MVNCKSIKRGITVGSGLMAYGPQGDVYMPFLVYLSRYCDVDDIVTSNDSINMLIYGINIKIIHDVNIEEEYTSIISEEKLVIKFRNSNIKYIDVQKSVSVIVDVACIHG